jgi:hypothetical protein
MQLPFDREQFLGVFSAYNTAIWPLQISAYVFGLVVLVAAWRGRRWSEPLIGMLLAMLWAFTGLVYHMAFFAQINPIARIFGIMFALQALLLFWFLTVRPRLALGIGKNGWSILGLLLVIYAAVLYPLLGAYMGHVFPAAPSFGLTPCPLAIFTFGVLLWARKPIPMVLLIIPCLWALIGFTAALKLGMSEDTALPISAAIAIWAAVAMHKKAGTSE